MYCQCIVFFDNSFWKFYHFTCHLENARASLAIFYPFILPRSRGPSRWINLSAIFRGVSDCELTDNFSTYCVLRMIQNISGWITTGVSFATLSGVSIDRLLDLTLHLRYNTIVTVQRMLQAVFMFCIVSVTVVMLRIWIHPWIIFPVVVVVSSFVVTTISTLKYFRLSVNISVRYASNSRVFKATR